jgi:phenylacetate-CoA ligase
MSLEDRLYPLLTVYERLPQQVRNGIGLGYRLLPKGWRYGARFGEFKQLAVAGERWSADEIRDYQLKQLRAVLHHAANHCPFYEKRFMRAGSGPKTFAALKI